MKRCLFFLDDVQLEKKEGEIIPDVIAYRGDKKLYIEIYVTHKIDDNKKQKIINEDVSTIEIDLSEVDRYITKEMLRDILLKQSEKKKWIYNSATNKWYKKFVSFSEIKKAKHCRVKNCPINTRRDKYGNSYALWIDDCTECDYCVGIIEHIGYEYSVRCTGKSRISEISDFKIPAKERILKSNNRLTDARMDLLTNGYCPFCAEKMVERNGKYGRFFACSNYKYCNFTYSIDENTGELKLNYPI